MSSALDLGTLKIGIEVDDKEAKQELSQFTGEVESAGSSIKSKLVGAAKVAKVATVAAIAATGAAVVKITKQSLEAYKQFEQLEGGISTLFGDASSQVMENASKAWKDAGMSANQYMETTIQSAAAMINSLGGDQKKAAELSNQALIDMSDNVNKMGTTMESVQNAYRGFSRGNFTMLDNLALGFAGTKEGMQELLDKAEEISGVKYDINSYSDIVQAIHEVQNEMGITGTTAKEAMSTIEGSVNAVKASWQNFLTGLGDEDADMDSLVSNLVTSVATAAKNIIPRIGQIVKSLVKTALSFMSSTDVKPQVDGLLNKVLDALKKAPQKFMTFIINTINQLADALEEEGSGKIASKAGKVLANVFTTLLKNIPSLVGAVIRLLTNLFQRQIESLGHLIVGIIKGIVNSVLNAWNSLKKAISERIRASIDTGALSTFKSWIDRAKSAWSSLKETLRHPIKALVNYAKSGNAGGTVKKKIGLREVARDGEVYELHKGEAILTASEANIVQKQLDKLFNMPQREPKQEVPQVRETSTNYYFGDITVDVSRLEDVRTVNEFVDMMKQAKAFV